MAGTELGEGLDVFSGDAAVRGGGGGFGGNGGWRAFCWMRWKDEEWIGTEGVHFFEGGNCTGELCKMI